MTRRERPADPKDRSTRGGEVKTVAAAQSSDAEARARRLEEIRLAIIEEWRWREPEKD